MGEVCQRRGELRDERAGLMRRTGEERRQSDDQMRREREKREESMRRKGLGVWSAENGNREEISIKRIEVDWGFVRGEKW